jgi:hypothetical protein
MIERAFLEALRGYLSSPNRLTPQPSLVGVAEPATAQELPAVVLSLTNLERVGSGLGERSTLMVGELPLTVVIDLANPILPGDPTFRLLSADRRTLSLLHGGLVRSDGTTGEARPEDIQVKVDGQIQTLVQGNPGANEFRADLLSGTLVFGFALPAQGNVEARYFIGQWEQRLMRTRGDLHALVIDAGADATRDLSDSLLTAFDAALAGIPGLIALSVAEVGPVGLLKDPVAARRRLVRFRFEYEFTLDIPDASGGIIREIPVTANLG